MSFKEFLIKNVMNSFFISVAFICIGIAAVGSVFEPDKRFSYGGFLAPIIFGLAASLPSLVMYSRHELTVGEMIFRKLLHLLLLELTINGILFLTGALNSLSVTISLAVTIFIIDVAVNAVMYINDLRSAERINRGIREIQSGEDK
ncbi:hypothetical protein [Huintestinicola sp.]|uniref:hypothetical protein n=1 Tax=Huintestinicola sp. TaxID=2981661 RepID=UPI003D7D1C2A